MRFWQGVREQAAGRALMVAASVTAMVSTGCTMATTASDPVAAPAAVIVGNVHGGRQPISGATVTLYEIAVGGYGSTATSAGSVMTGTDGSFSFGTANTCGTSSTLLLYIVASGGDPGSGTVNPAAKLMSVVGRCSASKTATVNIDEVSTVAAMYSLAQYFNPSTESFGRASTYSSGVSNAFATAGVLADLTYGQANTSLTTGTSNVVTITPETSKVNLIADILAACVNSPNTSSSTSMSCSTLFADAAPPPNGATTALGSGGTFPTAIDTLMAAYYLAVNPINATTPGVVNSAAMTALVGLAVPQSPFLPKATSVSDWTIGITYTGNFQNATSGCYGMSATTTPQIDSGGNLFYVNHTPAGSQCESKMTAAGVFSSSSPTTSNTLSPLSTAFTLDTANHPFYAGTVSGGNEILGASISPSANYTPKYSGSGITVAALMADGVTGGGSPADSAVLFLDATNGNLFEIANGTTASSSLAVTPLNSSALATAGAGPNSLALDHNGNVWVAETAGNSISAVTFPTANTPTRIASATAFQNPLAVAVDHANNVWVTNSPGGGSNGFLTYVTTGATPSTLTDTVNNDGGVNNPISVAVDGAGNAWVASAGQTVSGTANVGQTVSELYNSGSAVVPLSPSGTSGGFAHSYNGVSGVAIDESGNVWITNSAAVASATTSGQITEIVGAAVPTTQPLSAAVGSNKIATKP